MSIGRPQTVVTVNDVPATDLQVIRLHTDGDSLAFVADVVSAIRLDSLSLHLSAGGTQTVIPPSAYTLTPAFPDTVAGGVWGGKRYRLTYGTHAQPYSETYTLRARDAVGLVTDFRMVFSYDDPSRGRVPIRTATTCRRSPTCLLVQSPRPFDPLTEVTLRINGEAQVFTATAAPGDTSGREWVISWLHPDYPENEYGADIQLAGAPTVTRRFRVSAGTGEFLLADLLAFPNPFDNDGTNFSFRLLGSSRADLKISVMTISGRVIWSETARSVAPGYHQIPWNGNDAEGDAIANGVYFYRVSAQGDNGGHVQQLGRLVKLRRPRHVDYEVTP
jgi:hypothetical protein